MQDPNSALHRNAYAAPQLLVSLQPKLQPDAVVHDCVKESWPCLFEGDGIGRGGIQQRGVEGDRQLLVEALYPRPMTRAVPGFEVFVIDLDIVHTNPEPRLV